MDVERRSTASAADQALGRHYTDWIEPLNELKAQGRLEEAERILLACVDATERESAVLGDGVAPWYYEQLAIIYRKQRRNADEVAILNRFMLQKHAPGVMPGQLADRLLKATELLTGQRTALPRRITGDASRKDPAMHYEDLSPKIQELKREGRHEEALLLLEQWMSETEKNAQCNGVPVESWPYWQACVVLRKLKRFSDEVSVIERFLGQPSSGSKQSQELVDRLDKAYHLAGLTETKEQNGQLVVVYKPEGIPLDERALFVREAILVDTETTGLSQRDEVIELALLRFRYSHYSGRILEVKDSYVGRREPGCAISPQATKVNGLTKADVAGRQLDLDRIRSIVDGALMVLAHNASFDQRMTAKLLPELGRLPWYCTMNGIDWVGKGCSSRKLADICAKYGVDYGAHRADADVHALVDLLAAIDPDTARPVLHELIRDVPLGYVSSWQAQNSVDGEGADDDDDDDDGYVSELVITLDLHTDTAKATDGPRPIKYSAATQTAWGSPDESAPPSQRGPIEPLRDWSAVDPPKRGGLNWWVIGLVFVLFVVAIAAGSMYFRQPAQPAVAPTATVGALRLKTPTPDPALQPPPLAPTKAPAVRQVTLSCADCVAAGMPANIWSDAALGYVVCRLVWGQRVERLDHSAANGGVTKVRSGNCVGWLRDSLVR